MSAAEIDAFLEESFPGQMRRAYDVEEVHELGAVLRMPIGDEHQRPGGTVSGPAMMGLADGAAWVATLSRIGPVALSVTSSLTINFLRRPPVTSDIWADAQLIRLGRRLSVTDVRIFSEAGGELVAQSTVTYAIPAD
jgi:uncharacterized protein (TIGR00369 family)